MTNERRIRVGCQRWAAPEWVTTAAGETVLYPRGTKPEEMLPLYSKIFDTVEVDAALYGVPSVENLNNWYKQTPKDFIFSLKLPPEITHEKGLGAASFPVLDQFCSSIRILKEKLGPVLIQLPASFEPTRENAENLRKFLAILPRDLRFAIEFRDSRWLTDRTLAELEENRAALCLVEGKWIAREKFYDLIGRPMADFSYIRFMGRRDTVDSAQRHHNRDLNLKTWKTEIDKIKAGEIYIYFNKYYEGLAPASAQKLKKLLGLPVADPAGLEVQGSLF